jgi:hypothetical protein
MIVKVRIPETSVPVSRALITTEGGFFYAGEVLEVTPELSEKERLLSEVFSLNATQDFKKVLATIVNKAYEER